MELYRLRSNKRAVAKVSARGVAIAVAALVLLWIAEYSQRQDLLLTVSWPLQPPRIPRLSTSSGFWYSWSLIFSLFILLFGLFRRLPIALVAGTMLVAGFAFGNYRKLSILNDWLRPSDLSNLFGDAPFLIKFVTPWDVMFGSLFIVILIICLGHLLGRPEKSNMVGPWQALSLVVLSAAWLSVPSLLYQLPEPMEAAEITWPRLIGVGRQKWIGSATARALAYFGIENVPWNEAGSLQSNGVLLQFLLSNRRPDFFIGQAGYSPAAVCSGMHEPRPESTGIKPNIIFVTGEAFWDPRLLPRVHFSQDPLAAFDRVRAKAHQARLIAPVFGGLSVNTEFEILTGISIGRLPFGAVPFQALDHSIPSFPRLLGKAGYSSVAIIPYAPEFRGAAEAYRHLGFDRHVSSRDFVNPELSRGWISDDALFDKIVGEITSLRRPYFVHAVTMASHAPYDSGFPEWRLDVKGELSGDSRLLVRTFAQAVQSVAEMLERLVEYVDGLGEPTILVFLGDHLPALGANLAPYREGGLVPRDWYLGGQSRFIFSDDIELQVLMHSTPLLVYKNFPLRTHLPAIVSAFQIGGYVAREAGLDDYFFGDFLGDLSERLPAVHRRFVVNSEGRAQNSLDAQSAALLQRYDALIYDRLKGNQFSEFCRGRKAASG